MRIRPTRNMRHIAPVGGGGGGGLYSRKKLEEETEAVTVLAEGNDVASDQLSS